MPEIYIFLACPISGKGKAVSMAFIYNCSVDFSFDKALADCKNAKPYPFKGITRKTAEAHFWSALKTDMATFAERYNWDMYRYNKGYGYFADEALPYFLDQWNFSDRYKDIYNQRFHHETYILAWMLGLPTGYDIAATFCAPSIDEQLAKLARQAKYQRENFEFALDT